MSSQSFLQLTVSGRVFLLPLEQVHEVMLACETLRPHLASGALEGFLAVGEKTLPVLTLNGLLGFPEEPLHLYSKFIRIRGASLEYLLQVTEVPGIITVQKGRLIPQDDSLSFHGCISGLVKGEDEEDQPVLDVDHLLEHAEIGWIQDWEEQLADRIPAPKPLPS